MRVAFVYQFIYVAKFQKNVKRRSSHPLKMGEFSRCYVIKKASVDKRLLFYYILIYGSKYTVTRCLMRTNWAIDQQIPEVWHWYHVGMHIRYDRRIPLVHVICCNWYRDCRRQGQELDRRHTYERDSYYQPYGFIYTQQVLPQHESSGTSLQDHEAVRNGGKPTHETVIPDIRQVSFTGPYMLKGKLW